MRKRRGARLAPPSANGPSQRLSSVHGLKHLIEKNLIDLSINMDACIAVIKSLQSDSQEQDPELLSNIKEQVSSLKDALATTPELKLNDVTNMVEQCQENIIMLISNSKDFNAKAMDRFLNEIKSTLKTCHLILSKSDEFEVMGIENHKLLINYVTQISESLTEQIEKLEEYRPFICPHLPEPKGCFDKNTEKFDTEKYFSELDNLISTVEEKMKEFNTPLTIPEFRSEDKTIEDMEEGDEEQEDRQQKKKSKKPFQSTRPMSMYH